MTLALRRRSCLDPALKDGDLISWPGPVAGHRAVAKALQDGTAVAGDVVVRPKVERPFHRLTVALPKERLDVVLEGDGFVGCGQNRPPGQFVLLRHPEVAR